MSAMCAEKSESRISCHTHSCFSCTMAKQNAFQRWERRTKSHGINLAYIVDIHEVKNDTLYGDLFPVNYLAYTKHIKENAVEMRAEKIWVFEKGIKRGTERPASLDPYQGYLLRGKRLSGLSVCFTQCIVSRACASRKS